MINERVWILRLNATWMLLAEELWLAGSRPKIFPLRTKRTGEIAAYAATLSFCSGCAWKPFRKSAARCAWAAALKIARLSFFRTFSQLWM